MADFPSYQDLFRVARDEMLARNTQITKDAIDRRGTDANAIVAGAAAVGDEDIGQLARVQGDLFLDSAKGSKLDRLIIDRYNLYRKPAAPGFTSASFSTSVGAPVSFAIPGGSRFQTSDGRQWITLVDGSFPQGSVGPINIAVRSVQAGISQQIKAGQLTNILDVPPGSPGDLKVTNLTASTGADDREEDDDYRNRARNYFVTARRGTLGAIQNAALSIPGVRRASVFETIDGQARPARVVELIVADAYVDALVGTSYPPAYDTQSQVFAAFVSSQLDEARAAGIYVSTKVGQVVMLPIQLALTFRAGADVDVAAFQARSLIVGYVNSLAPGQIFSRVTAATVLQSVQGLQVSGNEVLSPAGNVVPQTLQVLRTSLSMVAAVSLQPDRALQGSTNPDGV